MSTLQLPSLAEDLVGRNCRWKDGSGTGSQIVAAYPDRDPDGRVQIWVLVMSKDGHVLPAPVTIVQVEARAGMFDGEAEDHQSEAPTDG